VKLVRLGEQREKPPRDLVVALVARASA